MASGVKDGRERLRRLFSEVLTRKNPLAKQDAALIRTHARNLPDAEITVARIGIWLVRDRAATALIDGAPLLLFEAGEGAALLGLLVLDDAVDLASLMPLWQVLGYRKTFRIAEE